jgi:site-specific DNA-methyltransferase (adenine-specific)
VNQPYYSDNYITLYHGDMREVLPALRITVDACVTDPPYGETSLAWDRWVDGWPALVAQCTRSMWSFGSTRMFLNRGADFADWSFSQDVVWRKNTGTSPKTDRFRRVHEHALHWYRGAWDRVYHVTPRVPREGRNQGTRRVRSTGDHVGVYRQAEPWCDDGTRLMLSVIDVKTMRLHAIHKSEKPGGILAPLIEYAVPPDGLVLDPFAGSGSTGLTARQFGRRSVLIEADEESCERAAERLLASTSIVAAPIQLG